MNINPDSAKEIPCKNVLIYGFCKFENKGCVFSHSTHESTESATSPTTLPNSTQKLADSNESPNNVFSETSLTQGSEKGTSSISAFKSAAPSAADSKRKFNLNTPSFQPSVQSVTSKFTALSPKVKEVPAFLPSGMESLNIVPTAATPGIESAAGRKFNASTPSFTPSSPYEAAFTFSSSTKGNSEGFSSLYGQLNAINTVLTFTSSLQASQQDSQPQKQANPYLSAPTLATPSAPVPSNATGANDYMFHSQGTQSYPLNHHLYAPAPPPRLATSLRPHETNVNEMFIPNNLRELLTKKNETTLQSIPLLSLPDHIGVYHSLVPIDTSFEQISSIYQLPSCVYKVLSNQDGLPYVLRRIDQSSKFRILNELPFSNVKKWKSIKNSNVVRLHDAFTSVSLSANGEPSLFLAYDYFPLANTLQEQHITRKLGGKLEPITEEVLWSYLVQLTSALVSIHKAGLYAGSSLTLSKVLVTNKNRVRLGAVGVDDIFNFESMKEAVEQAEEEEFTRKMQHSDVIRLGKLVTDLASTMLPTSFRGLPTSSIISHLQKSSMNAISDELANALSALQDTDGEFHLGEFYASHLSQASLALLNGLQDLTDFYEAQLLSEVENGRLFRLLAKINVVLDRPENDGDTSGSTFVIRLFRDNLFQTFDEYGKPAVDLSRILANLNKLDVGVDEKMLLISRDEASCIIISYKEVKDILEQNFRGLIR